VTAVAVPAPDGRRFVSSLWELDPGGVAEPRRITRSQAGEALAGFTAGGALLFISSRRDPDVTPDGDGADGEPGGLWSLPPGGGDLAAHLLRLPPPAAAEHERRRRRLTETA